jgi:hypothetical protein
MHLWTFMGTSCISGVGVEIVNGRRTVLFSLALRAVDQALMPTLAPQEILEGLFIGG